jgi:hypothetical protein
MKDVDKAADTFNAESENKVYCIFNTFLLVMVFEKKKTDSSASCTLRLMLLVHPFINSVLKTLCMRRHN